MSQIDILKTRPLNTRSWQAKKCVHCPSIVSCSAVHTTNLHGIDNKCKMRICATASQKSTWTVKWKRQNSLEITVDPFLKNLLTLQPIYLIYFRRKQFLFPKLLSLGLPITIPWRSHLTGFYCWKLWLFVVSVCIIETCCWSEIFKCHQNICLMFELTLPFNKSNQPCCPPISHYNCKSH